MKGRAIPICIKTCDMRLRFGGLVQRFLVRNLCELLALKNFHLSAKALLGHFGTISLLFLFLFSQILPPTFRAIKMRTLRLVKI